MCPLVCHPAGMLSNGGGGARPSQQCGNTGNFLPSSPPPAASGAGGPTGTGGSTGAGGVTAEAGASHEPGDPEEPGSHRSRGSQRNRGSYRNRGSHRSRGRTGAGVPAEAGVPWVSAARGPRARPGGDTERPARPVPPGGVPKARGARAGGAGGSAWPPSASPSSSSAQRPKASPSATRPRCRPRCSSTGKGRPGGGGDSGGGVGAGVAPSGGTAVPALPARLWDVNQRSLYLRDDQLVAGHLQGANAALEEKVFWVPNRALEPARLPVILGIRSGSRCLRTERGPAGEPRLRLQDVDIRELPRAGDSAAAFTFFRSYRDGLWRFESAAHPGWFLCTSPRGHQPLALCRHRDVTSNLLDFYFQLC
ncbi:uncharacterized protein LOC141731886 isoform X1 [Zonotrichia albicollis]|uniref:uncharacterized protein LOC141731886 isoform X1 n=1 Tax=Zonotrichia albicollis TaxID=44394 RepID=UPI003D810B5B